MSSLIRSHRLTHICDLSRERVRVPLLHALSPCSRSSYKDDWGSPPWIIILIIMKGVKGILARSCALLLALYVVARTPGVAGFSLPAVQNTPRTTLLSAVGGKPPPKKKTKLTREELSYLESRDMTRDEMKQLNAENERVMNQELAGMTIFSLIISLPLLYLAWVGFFSETAEIAMQ